MKRKKKRYVLMKVNLWKNVEALLLSSTHTPFPMPVSGDGRSSGFLLVYDSLGDLIADNGNAPYVAVSVNK
jgi:hypothetical protein